MTGVIERAFAGAQVVALTAVAVLVGLAVVGLVEPYLMTDQGPERSRVSRSTARRASPPPPLRGDATALKERSMFCSSCARPRPRPRPISPAPGKPERLDGVELLATLLPPSSDVGARAEVRFSESGRTRLLARGTRVSDAVITLVSARQVEFERAGRVGVLELTPGPTAPQRVTRPRREKGLNRPAGIRRLGRNRFALERGLLEELMRGLGAPSRHGVVRPLQRRGRLAGFRIQRLKPGGIFGQLGLRPGDEITSVNNQALTSPDVVLGLLGQLRSARHVTLGLVRAKRALSIDYRID